MRCASTAASRCAADRGTRRLIIALPGRARSDRMANATIGVKRSAEAAGLGPADAAEPAAADVGNLAGAPADADAQAAAPDPGAEPAAAAVPPQEGLAEAQP